MSCSMRRMRGSRRFEVRLHVDDVDPDAPPLAGLLSYQLRPETGPSGGLGVSAGVATRIRLGAWPEAYDGATAQLALDGPTLRRVDGARSGIDGLLPELPRVLNRGPGELRARTTNGGEALLQTETSLTLTRLSWWSLLPFVPDDGVEVLVYRDRAALLLLGLSRARRRFTRWRSGHDQPAPDDHKGHDQRGQQFEQQQRAQVGVVQIVEQQQGRLPPSVSACRRASPAP